MAETISVAGRISVVDTLLIRRAPERKGWPLYLPGQAGVSSRKKGSPPELTGASLPARSRAAARRGGVEVVLGFIASAPAPARLHMWAASSLEHVVHQSVDRGTALCWRDKSAMSGCCLLRVGTKEWALQVEQKNE